MSSSSSSSMSIAIATRHFRANAAETVGKDDGCNDSSCLGVWDGMLADCPHDGGGWSMGGGGGRGAGCVSSQDDTPGIFAEPWDYSDEYDAPAAPTSSENDASSSSYASRMDRLLLALDATSRDRGDEVAVILREGRYLRCLVIDGNTGERSVCEFYFTPNDTTVQFRLGATTDAATSSYSSSSSPASSIASSFGRILTGGSASNSERAERIRLALRYGKVPVLRNRKRALFFVESDAFDGFGPGSAMLGPPEEMSPGDMESYGGGGVMRRTRRGSDDVDSKTSRIDWVESFPFK